MNTLYYGDNRDILPRYVKDESVDLIYLDPPFKSNQDYNVLFAEQSGEKSAAQIMAFEDTWHWNAESAKWFEHVVSQGGKAGDLLVAFHRFLGENDMMAYLANMAPCLVELRRVLKPTGSIYLHCDPTASHYLKLLMDAVFGAKNVRNEIIWRRYKRPKGSQFEARKFGVSTDTLLFYGKTEESRFYIDRVKIPLDEDGIKARFTLSDEKGKYYSGPLLRSSSMGNRPNLVYEYNGFTPGPEGWRMTREKLEELDQRGDMFWTSGGIPRRKVRLDDFPGVPVDNLWIDIEAIGSQASERLGYPTQKPEALLERIIKASSNEGDVVLDPFCGCGTAVAVAQKLNRKWIGIDITHLAITLIKKRLRDSFGDEVEKQYSVFGEPVDLQGAVELAEQDKYQFQWWALGLVGARPEEQKKGADRGIDGRRTFFEGKDRHPEQILISVKGGKTSSPHVRDLVGTMEREKAALGLLITLNEPTRDMIKEAASAGFYHSEFSGTKHQKVQILTIEKLLEGHKPDLPPIATAGWSDPTFKKAPKVKKSHKGNLGLELE